MRTGVYVEQDGEMFFMFPSRGYAEDGNQPHFILECPLPVHFPVEAEAVAAREWATATLAFLGFAASFEN
jgi:hypothetical protein